MAITVAPIIAPFTFGDHDYTLGMSGQINCIVIDGTLPVDISWTFHGSHSNSSLASLGIETAKFGSRSSVLNIDYVEAHHAGNYTCIARNVAAVRNYTTVLNVYGSNQFYFDFNLPVLTKPNPTAPAALGSDKL